MSGRPIYAICPCSSWGLPKPQSVGHWLTPYPTRKALLPSILLHRRAFPYLQFSGFCHERNYRFFDFNSGSSFHVAGSLLIGFLLEVPFLIRVGRFYNQTILSADEPQKWSFFKKIVCPCSPVPHRRDQEIRDWLLSPLPSANSGHHKFQPFPQEPRRRFPLLPAPPSLSPNTLLYPAFNWPFLSDMRIFPIPLPLLQELLHGMIQKPPRRLPFLQGKQIHPLPEVGVDKRADEGSSFLGLIDGLCEGLHCFLSLRRVDAA